MQIAPFSIEEFFAKYEFSVPHILCASDCESMSVGELLALAQVDASGLSNLHLGYTESQGHPHLRAAIAGQYRGVTPDDVVVLAAPEEGIYIAMQTLLEPGDDVVVVSPAYDSLRNVALHICGAEHVHYWPVRPDGPLWTLSLDELETKLTAATRLLIVNFPHNPTGYLPDRATFEHIVALAERHGIWLFCDEMYRGLELRGRQTLPSAAELYQRSIVLAGLSKVHGLPGLRAGWLVVRDEAMRARLINWKHYTSICAPAPSEFLATVALRAHEALVARSRGIIERNLDEAEGFFSRRPDLFTWRPPSAGSVALVELHLPSATAHCEQLIADAGVLMLPGPYLGHDDRHMRLGLGRLNFAQNLAVYDNYLHRCGY